MLTDLRYSSGISSRINVTLHRYARLARVRAGRDPRHRSRPGVQHPLQPSEHGDAMFVVPYLVMRWVAVLRSAPVACSGERVAAACPSVCHHKRYIRNLHAFES